MNFDCDSAISASDFTINKSSAFVILFNTETRGVKLREAKCFGKINFERSVDEEILIADPKRANGKDIHKIVFYGDRDTGKSLISSTKDEDLFIQDEVEVNSTNSRTSTRTTRNSQDPKEKQGPPVDIYKLLAVMRAEQKEVKQYLDKFENENKSLRDKLDELIAKNSKESRSNRLQSSEVTDLLQHCTAEVARKRLDVRDFEERLKKIPWDTIKVNKEAKKNIIDELRFERRVSKMVSKIGYFLFGTELLTHLLGRYGKRERTRRESERPHVFNIQQESRLRRILGVFDDTFTSDKAWKHVVQYHINQKGRDVKKSTKRSIDEVETESETESEPESEPARKKATLTKTTSHSDESSVGKGKASGIGKSKAENMAKDKEREKGEGNEKENENENENVNENDKEIDKDKDSDDFSEKERARLHKKKNEGDIGKELTNSSAKYGDKSSAGESSSSSDDESPLSQPAQMTQK